MIMKNLHYFAIKSQEIFFSSLGGIFLLVIGLFHIILGPSAFSWKTETIWFFYLLIQGGYFLYVGSKILYYKQMDYKKIHNPSEKIKFLQSKYRELYKNKLIIVKPSISENTNWQIIEAKAVWGLGYYKYILIDEIKDSTVEDLMAK